MTVSLFLLIKKTFSTFSLQHKSYQSKLAIQSSLIELQSCDTETMDSFVIKLNCNGSISNVTSVIIHEMTAYKRVHIL